MSGKADEFCAVCGVKMLPMSPEEQAQADAEYAKNFPNGLAMGDERAAVCDRCYKILDPQKWPEVLAAAETYPELN